MLTNFLSNQPETTTHRSQPINKKNTYLAHFVHHSMYDLSCEPCECIHFVLSWCSLVHDIKRGTRHIVFEKIIKKKVVEKITSSAVNTGFGSCSRAVP